MRITIGCTLIPTRPRNYRRWHPAAEFFVCLFACAVGVAWLWVIA